MADDESKRETARIVKGMNGYCEKSPDGKHAWEPYEGGSRCKYCESLTEKRLLLD